MKYSLTSLSIRKKQAFAALCLAKFCSVNHISHTSIRELIEHLLTILITDNLSNWEKTGAQLELTGRGDPLPKSLETILPENIRDAFSQLVGNVVEVGLVDMYGATSEKPHYFLSKCIDIMLAYEIDLPLADVFFEKSNMNGAPYPNNYWGDPVSPEEYGKVLNYHNYQLVSEGN